MSIKYDYVDKIQENEMGKLCGEVNEILVRKHEQKGNSEDLGTDDSLILK